MCESELTELDTTNMKFTGYRAYISGIHKDENPWQSDCLLYHYWNSGYEMAIKDMHEAEKNGVR